MTNGQINILIVEDEAIVAMDLAAGLEQDGYTICGIADNATEAIAIYQQHAVDILLMDINIIGEKDGITLTAELQQLRQVPVIFLTAFTDAATVERVKAICPAAFLTKPYNISNVRIAIELALNNFAVSAQQTTPAKLISMEPDKVKDMSGADTILQLDDYIFIKNNYRFQKIMLSGIQYAESDNNYVQLITANGKFTLRLPLNTLLEKISYAPLVRIHRSYAVNISAVEAFNDQDVFIGGKEIPIGRNYKEEFLNRFRFK